MSRSAARALFRPLPLLTLWAALAACSAPTAAAEPPPPPPGASWRPSAPTAPQPPIPVPPDWERVGPARFEAAVLAGRPTPSEEDYERLATALTDLSDLDRATRAAVILARARQPRADRLLLARLEARHVYSERQDDAPDVVAAAGLAAAARAPDGEVARRLVALSIGPDPHPDLEARVECAVSALDAGREEVVPLLLGVLFAGTPAEREHPPDWPPQRTLAWVKSRAALALSRRAGTDLRFRADGPFADQIAEARRLARLLGQGN